VRRLRLLLVSLLVAVVAAGVVFLLTWDIPPPSQQVEKVIPDERFSR
jgi:hypothetical protein